MAHLKVGVLISGHGSNMEALIAACEGGNFPARIGVVISNNPDASGLKKAQTAGISTAIVDHRDFPNRENFERELDNRLRRNGVELVCLAGFMRILTPHFVGSWENRLINIHPSLLPAFKGLHVHERAIEAGVRFSGCTVHFVRPEMDSGPIIVQAAVPVDPTDTPDSLAKRVLAAEHRCYPLALKLIAENRVTVGDDGRVTLREATRPEETILNPSDRQKV